MFKNYHCKVVGKADKVLISNVTQRKMVKILDLSSDCQERLGDGPQSLMDCLYFQLEWQEVPLVVTFFNYFMLAWFITD